MARSTSRISNFPEQLPKRSGRRFTWRRVALRVHRYVGLVLAVFLVVSGGTGSLLAFHHELDAFLNPQLFAVEPASSAQKPLAPVELRELALRYAPKGASVGIVPLNKPEGQAVSFFVDLPQSAKGADNEYFLDPFTGELKGTRFWGDPRQGRKGIMPFTYCLHSSLALGDVGSLLLGVVALLWTFDCFVGAYLTFPVSNPRGRNREGKGWFLRWRKSWLLRTTRLFSSIFTWHRASGLWVWGMLFVFAWSGVSLNLHEVYHPIMRVLAGPEQPYNVPPREEPLASPKLSFAQAHLAARAVLSRETAKRDIVVFAERSLRYRAPQGLYEYRVFSSRDVSKKYANTTVWIDANTGEGREVWFPTGESANDTFSTWIYQLHFGTVAAWGRAHQWFVLLMGGAVSCLSGTGVWIWWVKRSK